jgi:hypothetical protein
MTPTKGVTYLLCSTLHDDTFKRFEDFEGEKYLWHTLNKRDDEPFQVASTEHREFLENLGREHKKSIIAVEGGSTTGLRGFDLLTLPGFRRFHLFGFDSSAPDGAETLHPYPKPINDPLGVITQLKDPISGDTLGRKYRTSTPMAQQAMQFELLMRTRGEQIRLGTYPPVGVTVHGSGLIPDWAALREMHHDPNRAEMLRAEPGRSKFVNPTPYAAPLRPVDVLAMLQALDPLTFAPSSTPDSLGETVHG